MKGRRGRKKRIAWNVVCALLALGLLCGTWGALKPLPVLTATAKDVATVKGDVRLAWPSQGQAAVGVSGFGGVLASRGEQKPAPIASVAKVITSLAVLERQPLSTGHAGPLYTISAADVDLYNQYRASGGSVVRVTQGEQISEYQVLQAILIPSANNLADSLAIWTFGSLDNYITYANAMLQRLGLHDTTVGGDASGFSPKTTSTASDLVLLGQAAMANSVIGQIVAQDQAELPVAGTVHSTNWLLGQEGVKGLKTGNTEEAGGCFLGAASHTLESGQRLTIVSAVIGAEDRNLAMAESLSLIKSAKASLGIVTPVLAGQVLGDYHLPWGGAVKAVASQDLSLVTWTGNDLHTKVELGKITGPLDLRATVGTVRATSGYQAQEIKVVLDNTMPSPSWWWRLKHSW